MNPLHSSPLGQASVYADRYDPTLLFPIPRAPNRAEIGLGPALPFMGADMWTGFELGWLGPRGKPQVAIAHLIVPCETVNLVESKSLKLYLGSFNQTVFPDAAAVQERLRTDLNRALWGGAACQSSVSVRLVDPERFDQEAVQELDGLNLDRLEVECDRYAVAPDLLNAAQDEAPVQEVLTSRLFRSLCPVTGQPDWAGVRLAYTGAPIDQAGLLRYLVSFRQHAGFHEQCVERIFLDVWQRCRPSRLSVLARYTRRGGLDINPFRTSHAQALPANVRTARQ